MTDILGVEFETEMREGVPHFKEGQRAAFRDAEDDDVAILLSTNQFGHCVMLACWRIRDANGEPRSWKVDETMSKTLTANGLSMPVRLPPCFVLSEEAIRELDNAEVATGEDR